MQWRVLAGRYVDRINELRERAPHELLEVSAEASPVEIRKAYRAKARAYHPDRIDRFLRPHGEEVMRLLNAAYERLTAGEKR